MSDSAISGTADQSISSAETEGLLSGALSGAELSGALTSAELAALLSGAELTAAELLVLFDDVLAGVEFAAEVLFAVLAESLVFFAVLVEPLAWFAGSDVPVFPEHPTRLTVKAAHTTAVKILFFICFSSFQISYSNPHN